LEEKTPVNTLSKLGTIRCEVRFKFINHMKDASFFDELAFFNYETGKYVKGAELRDCQTGCEIYERLGWGNSVFRDHKCGCIQYDEQLQFVSEKNVPLSNIEYRLTLGDGRTLKGNTDNDGKTMRVRSANQPLSITKAEFFVPDNMPRCPEKGCSPGKTDEAVKQIEIEGIETTRKDLGNSFRTVVVKMISRPLTVGEIDMCRLVFQDSIDYTTVRVHNEEYLPFGLQPDDNAMTPNGEIYYNPDEYKLDYSVVKPEDRIWFIHEMVHVWQYQLGYWIKWHAFWLAVTGGYVGGRAYQYDPAEKFKTLPDYNMEQQGNIIARYYGAKYIKYERYIPELPFFERVLKEFIRRPKNAALLPK
jgi:hypothetical protein